MSEKSQNKITFAARILMAILFLLSGVSKIGDFAGTVGYIASKEQPMPEVGAVIALVVEVGGALALITGFHTRLIALIMAVFTVAAAVFFHNFWAVPAADVIVNQVMFLKNLSITGGLLMFVAFGAGGISLDAKRKH